MEDEDRKINSHKPILEYDASGSDSPSESLPNGRTPMKFSFSRVSEEVAVAAPVAAAEAAPIPPAEELKRHYCKECNKSFSCGKALGGHMSSAHVQANKGYSCKKLNTKMRRPHKGSGPAAADNSCKLCGKVFLSKKSLFGHMRCHPERYWRGMEPPPPPSKPTSDPELGQNQDGYEEDGSGSSTPIVGCNLTGWPTSTKRGRGPINPNIRASGSSSEDNKAFVAGRQLRRLLEGESGKQKIVAVNKLMGHQSPESDNCLVNKELKAVSNGQKLRIQEKGGLDDGLKVGSVSGPLARHWPESEGGLGLGLVDKKRKADFTSTSLRIEERDAIDDAAKVRRKIISNDKGKAKAVALEPLNSDTGSTLSLPDGIDYNDESFLGAIFVLANGMRNQIENQTRVLNEKTMLTESNVSPKQEKEKGDSEKYICNICKRSFPTHQALGGHMSSHNKVTKLTIINTADRKSITLKEKRRQSKEEDENQAAEKVALFDLNMMPEEEDGYGDAS